MQQRQTGHTNLMTIRSREKGGRKTGNLSATLAEELESKTAFTIPVFGGVPDRRECSCYMGDHGSAVSTFTDTGS